MVRVPLNASSFGPEEIQAAIDVLHSGMLTMGARCSEFEAAFAAKMGVKNAVFVNSGSSANLVAFFALTNPLVPQSSGRRRLLPGDEVIVPAVTWSTTVWPIVQAGAVPVLVDSDPDTLQIDVSAIEAAVTPRTVAICPVHVLGNAVPMQQVHAVAERNGLWIIEDTCESLGTRHAGRLAGTTGDVGTYSFFFSHHITTIEGGMLVTPHDDLAELFRALRSHGWTRHLQNREQVERRFSDIDPRFLFLTTGFNVRPTEINAAFGILQLGKLDCFNKRRMEIAEQLTRWLQPVIDDGLISPMKATIGTAATWFGFPVICRSKEARNELQAYLEENGIETRPIIAGNLARQPAFKHVSHRIAGTLRGADRIMDCGLFWGSHPMMSDEEVSYIARVVLGYFDQCRKH